MVTLNCNGHRVAPIVVLYPQTQQLTHRFGCPYRLRSSSRLIVARSSDTPIACPLHSSVFVSSFVCSGPEVIKLFFLHA